jgi:hypothetical protein
MNTLHRSLLARFCIGAATLLVLGACSVSQATKDTVARADTRFQQAKQALGNSEGGAIELQRASDHLQQAKEAVKDGDEKPAQRHAQQAELDVELALAKAQNATARKAASEVQAGVRNVERDLNEAAATPAAGSAPAASAAEGAPAAPPAHEGEPSRQAALPGFDKI